MFLCCKQRLRNSIMDVRTLDKCNRKILLLIVTSPIILCLLNHFKTPENLSFIIKPPEDIYDLLIDYKGFKFVLNPLVCPDRSEEFVIVTVPSAPESIDFRKAIRRTWGRWDNEMKVIFFLGLTKADNVTRRIRGEIELYGDIVQGNFVDTYRNLSYKHVMILKWVKHYCPEAKFIVKIDDDTVVDLNRMYKLLQASKWGRSGVIACYLQPNSSVQRVYRSWNISREEYPDYCSGYVVVYSRDVAVKLLVASRKIPYYFIEDVFVTGLLAKHIGVKPVAFKLPLMTEMRYKFLLTNQSRLKGQGPFVIGATVQNWQEIRKLWFTMQRYNFKIDKKTRIEMLKGKLKLATIYPLPTISKRKRKHNVIQLNKITFISYPI